MHCAMNVPMSGYLEVSARITAFTCLHLTQCKCLLCLLFVLSHFISCVIFLLVLTPSKGISHEPKTRHRGRPATGRRSPVARHDTHDIIIPYHTSYHVYDLMYTIICHIIHNTICHISYTIIYHIRYMM